MEPSNIPIWVLLEALQDKVHEDGVENIKRVRVVVTKTK